MTLPFSATIGADAVTVAGRILQALDALSPAERTQITGTMKVYEQQIGDVTWAP